MKTKKDRNGLNGGMSPLHRACQYNNLKVASFYITYFELNENDVYQNMKDDAGLTPLEIGRKFLLTEKSETILKNLLSKNIEKSENKEES